jgi:GntR family transcriptional regulator/MocR family aminotransferase
MSDLGILRSAARSGTFLPRGPKFIRLSGQDKTLPLNEQVYRRVRHLILSGAMAAGSRLAPSRALAASLGISRNSVLTALDRLIADGLLESRRSSGVYVCSSPLRIPSPHPESSSAGTEITPFELGWPTDIFPLDVWKRLQKRNWREISDRILQQGDRLGLPALRRAIADYLAVTRGLECSANQVIVTTSIPSGIDLAIQALGLSGSEAWVEDPCCRASVNALLRSGVRLTPVSVDKEGIDVSAGKQSAPDSRIIFVTPTCQAPSGVTLSAKRRSELLQWTRASSAWVFEDDFNWNGDGITRSVRPHAVFDPVHTIYFNSFNHILFPGLRIAYLVVPTGLVDHFARVRGTEGEVNTSNQILLTDFIDGGHLNDHQRHLNSCNAERRAAVSRCVQYELTDVLNSQDTAGGYFICTLNGLSESAVLEATRKAGLVVTGMSSYRSTGTHRDEIILGYSRYKPAAISAATAKLKGILQAIHV